MEPVEIELPDNVVHNIILQLGGGITQQEFKRELLNLRLVCKQYKEEVDRFMTTSIYQSHVNWNPGTRDVVHPFRFPLLKTIYGNSSQMMGSCLCPPFLFSGSLFGNPFPTRSLVIGTRLGALSRGYNCMEVVEFVQNWGHHLTSLTLSYLRMTPFQLIQILRATPNLRILVINDVHFRLTQIQQHGFQYLFRETPVLPLLEFMQVVNVSTLLPNRISSGLLYKWLITAYQHHLIQLIVDEKLTDLGGQPSQFPKLEYLKIWKYARDEFSPTVVQSWPSTLKAGNLQFPNLKGMSLGNHIIQKGVGLQTLELTQNFLSRFSRTLNRLHLDLLLYIRDRPFAYSNNEVDQSLGWKRNKIRFPNLYELSINYPAMTGETSLVRDILRAFPNLEELHFIWCGERNREEMMARLDDGNYDRVCVNLKIITVRTHSDENSEFFRRLIFR